MEALAADVLVFLGLAALIALGLCFIFMALVAVMSGFTKDQNPPISKDYYKDHES